MTYNLDKVLVPPEDKDTNQKMTSGEMDEMDGEYEKTETVKDVTKLFLSKQMKGYKLPFSGTGKQ